MMHYNLENYFLFKFGGMFLSSKLERHNINRYTYARSIDYIWQVRLITKHALTSSQYLNTEHIFVL